MYIGLYKTPNKALSCLILSCYWTPDRNEYNPPPKKNKLSPNYSLDPTHPFTKKNYDPSAVDKTRSWIHYIGFRVQLNAEFPRQVRIFL